MYTQSAVKTAADLKGKSVAISSFGSQSHAGALLAVKSLGLATSDVTITQVGNDRPDSRPSRAAASRRR